MSNHKQLKDLSKSLHFRILKAYEMSLTEDTYILPQNSHLNQEVQNKYYSDFIRLCRDNEINPIEVEIEYENYQFRSYFKRSDEVKK
ncbi:MAG: hypothetical protein GY909_16125 [Oligoflexia bacterium]|nr:hypothetical protein [Oligoflexia bacterium]